MKPKISLLNSVSAAGLVDTAQIVRAFQIEYVDVYAFMQKDLELLWPESQVQRGMPRNAVYEMAAAPKDTVELNRIATLIENSVAPAKVAAFATYIPEITSPKTNQVASESASSALEFLVDLSAVLHEKGHPVSTIEIVGGSTVDGLWRGRAKNGAETYIVNRKNNDSLTRLATALVPLAKRAVQLSTPVRFALELEPGPLFNVFNKESLLQMCHLIESSPELSKSVGFNLDIPHWCFLANIDLTWVANHPAILKRIAHAHVSDHSSGHFCDAEPLLFHGASEFVPWIRLLSGLETANRHGAEDLPYSGFLTCELECCLEEENIGRSVHALKDLVDRHCQ